MPIAIFGDTFGHYNTAQGPRKWTFWNASIVTDTVGVGSGTTVLLLNGSGRVKKTLGSTFTKLAQGCAMYLGATGAAFFTCENVFSHGIGFSVFLQGLSDGRVYVSVNGGPASPISTFVFNINQKYYVEFYCEIVASSPGSSDFAYKVVVNGDNVILDSAILGNIHWTAGATGLDFAQVELNSQGSPDSFFANYYITDGELLGDLSGKVLYTNGDGFHTDFTPSSAGAHYLMTKEHAPDDDATTIASSTAGDKESETLDNTGFSGTVKMVQGVWCRRKTGAGICSAKGGLRIAGADYLTDEHWPSDVDYDYQTYAWRKSPASGSDFTTILQPDLKKLSPRRCGMLREDSSQQEEKGMAGN